MIGSEKTGTGTLGQEAGVTPPQRLGVKGALVVLLLTAAYFACFFYLPQKTRYVLIAVTAVSAALIMKPEPASWLPVLPLALIATGSSVPLGEFHPAIATLLMIAYTVFYAVSRMAWNRPMFVPSSYLVFIFLALLVQAASIAISIHFHDQYAWNAIRDGSSIFLFSPLVVIVPVFCSTEEKMQQLLRAIVMVLLVVGAIGILQFMSISGFSRVDISLGYVYRGRIASVFMDTPNAFAGYLELSIPVGIALFFREKRFGWKLISAAAVVLGALSNLYTFSRGGLICMFIGASITLGYVFRKKLWVPFVIGVLAVVFLLQNAETFERQMSFVTDPRGSLSQPTILHRYISYRGFFHQIADSPVTGIGWGAREFFWGRTRIYSFWEVRHCISTETIQNFGGLNSLFLNQMVKGGLVSLASLIIMLGAIFAAFVRAFRRGGGLLAVALGAAIFSFMIHQVVGNQIRFPTVNAQFWFVSSLLVLLAGASFNNSGTDGNRT